MRSEERRNPDQIPSSWRIFFSSALASSGYTPTCMFDFDFQGVTYKCGKKSWRSNFEGITRLIKANRIISPGSLPCFITFHNDFPTQPLHNLWDDTHGATDLMYVVQTSNKVIERCLLMTTDPGDLVLDPTCVRRGTRVFVWRAGSEKAPTPGPSPRAGRGASFPVPPFTGGLQGGPSTGGPQGGPFTGNQEALEASSLHPEESKNNS
jgi:hypothetical protein